jgi:hypothetical protein
MGQGRQETSRRELERLRQQNQDLVYDNGELSGRALDLQCSCPRAAHEPFNPARISQYVRLKKCVDSSCFFPSP